MNREEQLIALVLERITDVFGKRAVLRGGMVLRILGSARFTNDLDYVFVPYKSKKDLVPEILACLESLEGANVRYSLNSKCLRMVVTVNSVSVQVEAKAALHAETELATTRMFSLESGRPTRVICVADHSVALANKLAAWNERRLVRDLYDIWFFVQMGITPDAKTLETRLQKPDYSRLMKNHERYRGETIDEFYEFLRRRATGLTDTAIRESMSDYLPPDEMTGLAMQIRAALTKLVDH